MSGASADSGPDNGTLDRFARWMRRRKSDQGVGHALEAMVIGAVVLGAIGFAISSKAPPPPSQNAGSQSLADKTWDAVEALDKMHYPDASYGNSTLSKLVADAAGGDPDPLANSLEEFMPPGSEFQVYLNNGHDRFELYSNRSPTGQTVGVAYPIEPGWKHHYGQTGLRIHNANTSQIGMTTNLIPIFNSNRVQDEGHVVRAAVHGSTSWHGGLVNTQGTLRVNAGDTWPSETGRYTHDSYSSLIQGSDAESYPSASIYMQCDRGGSDVPCYGLDLTDQMDGYGPTANTSTQSNLAVTVENTGPGPVPAGTTLNVSLPVGVEVVSSKLASPSGGFDDASIEIHGNTPQPQRVSAELASSLGTGETAVLDLWVIVTDDRYAYKHVFATLEGDSTASSSQFLLVVEDKEAGQYTGADTRVALVSAPRPAGSGDNAHGRWAVVAPTPVGETELDEIALELPDGEGKMVSAKLPDDFDPIYPSETNVTDGEVWTPSGNVSKWKVNETLISEGYEFVEVQFNVTTDGTFTKAAPAFPTAAPEADFGGYEAPPHRIQREPGLWWSEHPPDEGDGGPLPGYGAQAGGLTASDPREILDATNRITHRNSELTGNTTYHLVDMFSATEALEGDQLQGAIKDATQASRIEPSPDRVSPGGSVDIDISARDLALFMSQYTGLNQQDMSTDVYAPWGIRDLTPAKTFEHQLGADTTQSPKLVMPAYLNGDDTQDLIVASTDANLYGLDGADGSVLTGKSYKLPDAGDPVDPAEPSHLTRASPAGGSQVYGVGTTAGFDSWYSLDENLTPRGDAVTPDTGHATVALNTSMDIVGDAIPDFVSATKLANAGGSFGDARIVLWDGADTDGDGSAEIVDGWTEDSGKVRVNGTPNDVGMANIGRMAKGGVFAATGLKVGSNVQTNVTEDPIAAAESTIDAGADALPNGLSFEVKDSGLVGIHTNGKPAWNLTGARFGDVERATAMDLGNATNGRNHDGLVGRMADGWVFGMNASQPVYPVNGWLQIGSVDYADVAFANELEGYWTSATWMYATTDAGTTYKMRNASALPVINDPDNFELHAVDTPDGELYSGAGEVSWWAGTAAMYRSPDRLETVEDLTTTADIVSTLTTGPDVGSLEATLSDATLDLADVKFNDVHAVSAEEAWFVGEGLTDSKAYLVHVQAAGETIDVYEIKCEGSTSFTCGANAVDKANDRIWVAGTNGLVLTANPDPGDAGNVSLVGSGGINPNGVLSVNLTSSEPTKIKNVAVDWSPTSTLDWTRGVTLNDDDNPDLWNKSEGGDHIESPLTNYNSEHGAARDATLYVDSYTQDVGQDSDRLVDGDATLTAGPFKKTLDPSSGYYGPSDYDSMRPLNFTVNVTVEDGNSDHYTVWLKEDGSVEAWDDTPLNWQTPSGAGYGAPDACFGHAANNCSAYNGINASSAHADGVSVAIVGAPNTTEGQRLSPLVRLGPGEDTFERLWPEPLNETLYDVAVTLDDPDRWVAVGAGPLAARSYDAGENWTVLPTPALWGEGVGADLKAVDASHPHVPMTVGGGSNSDGVRWWMGGYHENGSAITTDLHDGSEKVKRIDFDDSDLDLDFKESWSFADIEIWNQTAAKWDLVYDSSESEWVHTYKEGSADEHALGWETNTRPHYNFSGEGSDVVKLRFSLSTSAGFVPQSSMITGHLDMAGNTQDRKAISDDVNVSIDLKDTGDFTVGSLRDIDHNGQHGYLRLESVANPWVHKLGNYEKGDWGTLEKPTSGAFPTSMDLSPDGETLFVGTGGIYEGQTAPDGTELGDDDSLYAIDIDTGKRVEGFGVYAFQHPVLQVEAGEEKIWVVVGEQDAVLENGQINRSGIEDLEVHLIDRSTGIIEDSKSYQGFDEPISTLGMAIFDGFRPDAPHDDLALVLKEDSDADDGFVEARNSSNFEIEWKQNPSVTGDFLVTYDVPRDSLYGTHVVVTKVEWTITDDFGNDFVQTTRLHDTFTVTPPSKRIPLTPTYNLEVVAWMEDWQ